MLEKQYIRRFYLDEIKELADAPLSLSILYLIGQTESEAPAKARELIARTQAEIADEPLRRDLIDLIETIILYKLSHLSRAEVQAMLQVQEFRESRLFKEIKQEGKVEGKVEGLREGFAIAKLAAKNKTVEEIAAILKLDVELVRKAMADADQN
jgi:predicted transposase YdaD